MNKTIWAFSLMCVLFVGMVGATQYTTDIVVGQTQITTAYDDMPSFSLIPGADAKGGSCGGGARSFSGGSRSVSTSSRSSTYGASPSTGSRSAVYGTSSKPVQLTYNNGRSTISGSYTTKPYVSGTKKIASTTPKAYVPGVKYKKHGYEYEQVYYGPGFDLNSLLLIGFIMSHDDDGRIIYLNNETGEMVRPEDIESTEQAPGMESMYAMSGLLAVAYLVMRRND